MELSQEMIDLLRKMASREIADVEGESCHNGVYGKWGEQDGQTMLAQLILRELQIEY